VASLRSEGRGLVTKRTKIEGMSDIEGMFKQLNKVPQTAVNRAALSSARIVYQSAIRNAPEDTGDLKKGIVVTKEKKSEKGKRVYQIAMDPDMNDVFVKYSKEGKRAYYPASQEYGFIAKNGNYIHGFHFMRNAIMDNKSAIEANIIMDLSRDIDKALMKKWAKG
jgi:hypothetical protein